MNKYFQRCTHCFKEIEDNDTYITVHKHGRCFNFCLDCGKYAIEFMNLFEELIESKRLNYKTDIL